MIWTSTMESVAVDDTTVGEAIDRAAAVHPDRPALIDGTSGAAMTVRRSRSRRRADRRVAVRRRRPARRSGRVLGTQRALDRRVRGGRNAPRRLGDGLNPASTDTEVQGQLDDAAVSVVGAPHAWSGETPVAFAVASGNIAPGDLHAWIDRRLAPYKRPSAIHFVDQLPRTPSGKLLRRQLSPP